MDTGSVTTQILQALEELNQELSPKQRVPISPDARLFGQDGRLDSLGLVTLLLLVEERVADELGVSVVLADERAMSRRDSPFRSVPALAEYVTSLIRERQNG